MAKRTAVDLSDAMAELAAWAGVDDAEAIALDANVLQRAAREGLASLLYLARRNDRQAAQYLTDRFMGEPTVPFDERAKQMSAEEVRAHFIQRWQQAWGWSEEHAAEMFDRMAATMGRKGEPDGDED